MRVPIRLQTLTAEAFQPFGDVIEVAGEPDKIINQGLCGRYHDRATFDFSEGRAGLSLFSAEPRKLPLTLEMVERHPDGSQAFIPMSEHPFVVVVAPDHDGTPGRPQAYLAKVGQAVNYHRGTWHGVLMPIHQPGLFAVVDRIGSGDNLEEHWFDKPFVIER